ncbi:MAG TPA: hypothetical protein VKU00_27305 [Chthonomonadaceae bacterium]|nr:hypothetical protein [Chthonomonadaceae bacterium]
MNYANDPKRRLLIAQVLGATTLPEIEEATQALQQWVKDHPDDLGIVDGFEQLALMRICAEEKLTSTKAPVEPALVR